MRELTFNEINCVKGGFVQDAMSCIATTFVFAALLGLQYPWIGIGLIILAAVYVGMC